MRKPGWTPSIVPRTDDHDVYLVVDVLGRLGRVWREADYDATDWETVVSEMLDGQYKNPIGVFAFNTNEGWSRDVSALANGRQLVTLRDAAQLHHEAKHTA